MTVEEFARLRRATFGWSPNEHLMAWDVETHVEFSVTSQECDNAWESMYRK